MAERLRTLILKRSRLTEGISMTLEDVLQQIFDRTGGPRDRLLRLDLLRSAVVAGVERGPSNQGVYVRLFEFEEGALGSINFDASGGLADVEGVEPPKGQSFLQEDIGLFVVGNDVIATGMANKNRTYAGQLSDLAIRLGLFRDGECLMIDDVANQTTLGDLRRTGVKEIHLGVSDYLASLPPDHSLKNRVMDAIWTSPSNPEEMTRRGAHNGRLALSRGRFKKDEIKIDPWLTKVGERIVEEDDEDYSIVLEDGRRLTNSNLKVTRKVRVQKQYNTVSWKELKGHLAKFMGDLRGSGVI